MRLSRTIGLSLIAIMLAGGTPLLQGAPSLQSGEQRIHLPAVMSPLQGPYIVNAPYFTDSDIGATRFGEMAVFWFGQVDPTNNYTDVRVGYNNAGLVIRTGTFDRRLWYDESPSAADLTAWDAATLYLTPLSSSGSVPGASHYRFDAQFSGDGGAQYQAAYRGNGSGWAPASVGFAARPGWRGDRVNDNTDDRGWAMEFTVPFSSLGLGGRPADGTIWGIALVIHDRDSASGSSITPQVWPPDFSASAPATWGKLRFGLPGYGAPPTSTQQTITIRHRLNGVDVPDGMVGGGFTCGDGLDFWTEWGQKVYYTLEDSPGDERGDFNVQNQSDIADWPCFSKKYLTFPLDTLPSGRAVVSASLVLHQFGNSDPPQALPSLIQVMTVKGNWNEATLNWNNAPLASENVGRQWINPLPSTANFPGVPYSIDISRAVAEAYAAGTPLKLALYSSDSAYHSGKYFVSSDTGDWNATGRPTLLVTLGTP